MDIKSSQKVVSRGLRFGDIPRKENGTSDEIPLDF